MSAGASWRCPAAALVLQQQQHRPLHVLGLPEGGPARALAPKHHALAPAPVLPDLDCGALLEEEGAVWSEGCCMRGQGCSKTAMNGTRGLYAPRAASRSRSMGSAPGCEARSALRVRHRPARSKAPLARVLSVSMLFCPVLGGGRWEAPRVTSGPKVNDGCCILRGGRRGQKQPASAF
jgi:hypothetical protein